MLALLTPYTDREIAERLAALRAAEERRRQSAARALDVGARMVTVST